MNCREGAEQVLANIHGMVANLNVMGKVHFRLHHAEIKALVEMDEVCAMNVMAAAVVILEKLVADEKAVAEILKNAPTHK